MNTKRILSALLAAVMSLGVLVSCASDDAGKTDDTTPAVTGGDTVATEPAEDTTTGREGAKDNIPSDLRFDGQTISMIYRNENGNYYGNWDMTGTDNSGDVIFDAVWQRNLNVEDRFGISLNIQPIQATGLNNVATELKNLVFSASTRKSSSSSVTFSSSSMTSYRSTIFSVSPSSSVSATRSRVLLSFFSSTKSLRIISAIKGR